ncbi:MAG: NAD-dependent histone deacetylase sir2 [Trichoglossum hirsutum]|nr:MAG: NAD-dependent histone deacetylase sir2 [Trichoglossum hirsutum]
MESEGTLADSSSLRTQTVEIVNLLSDDETSIDDATLREETIRKDAPSQVNALEEFEESDENDEEDDLWDAESLYADALEGMGDEQLLAGETGACTLEEAIAYRQEARMVGDVSKFLVNTVGSGAITAKKLCTAFGVRPPMFLEGAPDRAYFILLGLGVARELSKRTKLLQYNTMDDAVELLRKSKNIIVITGAGISTSLGIPDFRSKETGLYSKLEHLGLTDPQEVFDIKIFQEDPSIFYSIAKDILPSTEKYSPTHAFIHLLQEKDKLLTNYTQNIDNLEVKAGIRGDKLVQCHGSFAFASCVKCRYQVKGDAIFEDLKAGRVAKCPRCVSELLSNGNKKRKRGTSQEKRKRFSDDSSADDGEYDIPEPGVMKPDITFFGESLPSLFHDRLRDHDRGVVDLVIVIGTSLKVAPVSEVIGFLPPSVPQIYISRTPVSHVNFDLDLLGDCDVVVAELCRRLNWDLKHEMIPKDQRVDVELQDGFESRYTFKVVK